MDPAYPDALPAQTRLHWYVIERVLGQGGFGITYVARDSNLDQRVAIKEYLPVEFATRTADSTIRSRTDALRDRYRWGLERFLQEARTLARFEHPNIVRVLSVFEFNNTAYMVMRFEEGASLAAVLDRRGTLPEGELLGIVLPILDGLEQIHDAGFIHRDIKPDNIYLRGNGQPVLLDFGSARQAAPGSSHTLTILVAPGYAPFEQYYSDSGNQGPWTDIYALAATCYRAIAGRPPLDAVARSKGVLGSTQDSMPAASIVGAGRYSGQVLGAIDHALAFSEKDRPQTIAMWRRELKGESPVATTTSSGAPATPANPTRREVSPEPKASLRNDRPAGAHAPTASADAPTRAPVRSRLAWMVAGGLAVVAVAGLAYQLVAGRTELAELRKEFRNERERSTAPRPLEQAPPRPAEPPVSAPPPVEPAPKPAVPEPKAQAPQAPKPAPIVPPSSAPAPKPAPKEKSPDPKKPVEPIPAPPLPKGEAPTPSPPTPQPKAEPGPMPPPPMLPLPPPINPTPAERLRDAERLYAEGRYADALKLIRELADEGNARAQFLLGEAYLEGRGVERDAKQAEQWLDRAAQRGNVAAMTRLGRLYAVAGDRNLAAYMWYGCAGRLGSGAARIEYDKIAPSLQPKEREQAERTIESCVKRAPKGG